VSELDDRIRDGLERLARPADGSEVVEDVARRRSRYRVVRRAQVATLVLGVVVGSAAGVWGLSRAFMGTPDGEIAAPTDGTLIAFERRQDGRDRIFLVGEDGEVRPLPIPEGGDQADPDWSPDGRTIAFTGTSGGTNIWTVSPDGGDLQQITSGVDSEFDPTWSPPGPGGDVIAFLRDEAGDGVERARLWIMHVDSGEETMVPTGPGHVLDPAWSRDADGGRIAFVLDRSGDQEIYVVNIVEGGLEQVTDGEGAARRPAWSPDGARIAYAREGVGLVVLDLQSGHEEILVPGEVEGPSWSPDGSRIVYAARRLDGWLLHEVSVADGTVDLFGGTAIPGRRPVWQPVPAPVVGPTRGPSPSATPGLYGCRADGLPFLEIYRPVGQDIEGSVLGDGRSARIRLLAADEEPEECRYFLAVEYPEGEALYAAVPPVEGVPSVPTILMAAEIDGEPGREIVVDIGGPGHPHRTGIVFTMHEGELVAMRSSDAATHFVPLGGEFAAGVDCAGEPGAIVTTEGTFADGGTDDGRFDITRRFFRAQGVIFEDFDQETFTVEVGEERERWPETDDDPFRSCPR